MKSSAASRYFKSMKSASCDAVSNSYNQPVSSTSAGSSSASMSIAEKLGLGSGEYELKFGETFTSSNPTTAFHTLKYDFKPASVDQSKVATVSVGENNMMTVTVPHLDGAGTPQTVFKGSQRPYQKECVLIIDHTTGEITLERLSANVQVKKTRSESKAQSFLQVPSSQTASGSLESRKSPTNGWIKGRNKLAKKLDSKKRDSSNKITSKPSPQCANKKSPPANVTNSSNMPSTESSTLASLPTINMVHDNLRLSPMSPSTSDILNQPSHSAAPPRTISPVANTSFKLEHKSVSLSDSSSSSSDCSEDSSSDDDVDDKAKLKTILNGHVNGIKSSASLPMPHNLLKEDLQLSDSHSECESD